MIMERDLTRYILFQVYIIMAKFDSGKGLPCVWCLLPNKSEDAYQLMWDAILKKLNMDGTTHQPERVVIDFEAAVIKTLRNRIPGVPVVGCSFHFRNAIWKKLQDLGLIPFFNQDQDFQEWIRMIYALSYVPVNRVVHFYDKVILAKLDAMTSAGDPSSTGDSLEDKGPWTDYIEEIMTFIEYMDRTWIGRKSLQASANGVQNVNRRRPMFTHDLWNQTEEELTLDGAESDAVVNSTNNMLESYNRTMKMLLGNRPNLWRFMESLVSQEADTRRLLVSNAAGLDLTSNPGRRQLMKDKHFRILSIIKRIDKLTEDIYLQSLAKYMDSDD
jgi:hypothetical protein